MTFIAVVLGLVLGTVAGYLLPLFVLRLMHRSIPVSTSAVAGFRLGVVCLLFPATMAAFFVGVPWGGGGGELLLGRHGIVLGMFVGAAFTMFLGAFLGAVGGGLLGMSWGRVFGTKSEA